MAERWKPPPTSAYKEDFKPRRPLLPADYDSTPLQVLSSSGPLPKSRAKFTNTDKVLWPREGYTKGDLIRYYDQVAEVLLPHLRDRPLILERYPNGIAREYFLQKDAMPQHTPDWLLPYVHEVYAPEVKRTIHYIVANHRDVLLFLANYAAITLHPWSSRLQTLEFPDFILFNFDPIGAPFEAVVKVALELKSVLGELRLKAYVKTSGVSGLHVYMPVQGITYADARTFAEAMASIVVQRLPQLVTRERSVSKRGKGKVYVDCLQNGRGKTLASVYSARPKPHAPVSTPLDWSEFKKLVDPTRFNIETTAERIKTVGDLFKPLLRDRQDIAPLLSALRAHR
jgi:bifunctional non-homologous end joining protein LigD